METEEKEVSYHMDEHLNEMIEVVHAAEVDEILKAVKSLISDIESMQINSTANADWFGHFSVFEVTLNTRTGGENAVIEWPNLAISLAAVKKLLEPQTIEGELTKSQISATIASKRGIPVLDVPLVDVDSKDLLGLPRITAPTDADLPTYTGKL
jgi:hypothetical protein